MAARNDILLSGTQAQAVLEIEKRSTPIWSHKSNMKRTDSEERIDRCAYAVKQLLTALHMPINNDKITRLTEKNLATGDDALVACARTLAAHELKVKGYKTDARCLKDEMLPALAFTHSEILTIEKEAEGLLSVSRYGRERERMEYAEIGELIEGSITCLIPVKISTTPEKNFGLGWFIPAIKRHRRKLVLVLASSFAIQIITLASPLLIQVIIDKVISQRSLDTLQVIGTALIVAAMMEGIMSSLKTLVLSDSTNEIDKELGEQVIEHMLGLPLSYFDNRKVGELSSRVGELEKIRKFLTGQGLSTILDSAFALIYICLMVAYSSVLTALALAVVPVQVLLSVIGAPIFRSQYRETASRNAATQSHIVEVLSGIQTIKSQNMQKTSKDKWHLLYDKYIKSAFKQTVVATVLNQLSHVLQQLSQLLVLWKGAEFVLEGEMTLGQLIAFRIIAGYVTQPLLRLSSIYQNIQEIRVSIERLSDVMNTPLEMGAGNQSLVTMPSIKGSVRFENIEFTFERSTKRILDNVSLRIPAEKFVAIAGESGSGKSTLVKLLPKLYLPQKGRILIDDIDISKVELYSLRRQIGVVPQEPILFSGTIRDNITLGNELATDEDVIRVARLADCHDFIMEQPQAYGTDVGERGSMLSGGQKQRIAIARTLLSSPRLLILDEATSALDYISEQRVCNSLMQKPRSATIIFITHRLGSVKDADMIVFMKDGKVDDYGSHQELIKRRGNYFRLYSQQSER